MWIQKREFQSKCVDLRVVEGVIIMGKAIKAEVEGDGTEWRGGIRV